MKYMIFLITVFVCSDLLSQDCTINVQIKDEYFTDSQILSVREIISDTNHMYKDSVILPKDITDKYLGLLSAVYDLHSALTDSIFNTKSIHIYPYPYELPYTQMVIQTDASFDWVNNFIQDSLISGNAKFDSITSLYGLKLRSGNYTSTDTFLHIGSSTILNFNALVGAFESIAGISSAYPDYSFGGDGNNIEATFSNDTTHIVFSRGWGDCPSGCISHHYWEFSVVNCVPKLERSYGDPLSHIGEVGSSRLSVFPNPFRNKIFITNPQNKSYSLLIYSISGKLLYTQKVTTEFIDLTMLDKGMYFLTIESDKGSKTVKIIKQ
jgi:hypothetical protein